MCRVPGAPWTLQQVTGTMGKAREFWLKEQWAGVEPMLQQYMCTRGSRNLDHWTTLDHVPALITTTTGGYGNARKKRDITENNDDYMSGYCVQFQLTSLSPGCQRSVVPHTRWMQYLREGHQVCVECQPPALAAGKSHCSGDGEDESGKHSLQWQAVGNPRCRGVWKRVGRLDSCSCPTFHSFLFI
ncbi:hypothetical protein DPEC_G00198960 [Dallia pectoralis]|uniref:Uncharacterized protein n=1 Tax=Dallia pectoralis TaxID=75939 RepID=A0ACC2G8F2_DALPE|nr:hypothetical protein DPEC_G00198960 [Dallia pectoralis]